MEAQTIKLFCGIVGARGSFPIEIDAKLKVGHLTNTIKKAKPNECSKIDADQLQLFVPKEGGEWLTEAQLGEVLDADVTSCMKELPFAQQPIHAIISSERAERHQLAEGDLGEGKGPVDVLVVVPKATTGVTIGSIEEYKKMLQMWFRDVLDERDEKTADSERQKRNQPLSPKTS